MKSKGPDFNRNLHLLLGLPFDAITLDEAVTKVRTAVANRTPCFFSTPNLNFLIAAQTNVAFRNSVIYSDLSLADGMPVIWLAKLMGIPIRERVAGSDVFEALRNGSGDGKRIKVYFFGGPSGIAEQAAKQINEERKGMECVGFESPGFGTVEEMSSANSIAKINESCADFLVVSLGAVKGQAWIEHNLALLEVPVVSHLGAVVNFVAGSVQRAPHWMQTTGLEWLWRVKEEPDLWRRYFNDGKALIKLCLTRVPKWLAYKWRFGSETDRNQNAEVKLVESPDGAQIQLSGRCTTDNIFAFRSICSRLSTCEQQYKMDISQMGYVDDAFLASLTMLIFHRLRVGLPIEFVFDGNAERHGAHIMRETRMAAECQSQ